MFRRFSAVLILCQLLLVFSHNLFAQVYPDREELDVVRLVDGTVLKGIILEQVPERYLEIELYGGSTFVLGYEQIESVEREANPDYGTTWIKIDLGVLDRGVLTQSESESDRRSLRDGGVVLGTYAGAGVGYYNRGYWDISWPGSGKMDASEEATTLLGIGLFVRVTGQPRRFAGTPWMLGFRGGGGYAPRNGTARTFGIATAETVEIITDTIHLPMEVLIGPAGNRFALYGGFGPGVSLLTGGPVAEGDTNDEVDRIYEEYGYLFESDRRLSTTITASLNGLIRLGRFWNAELRVAYDRLLIPWGNDSEMHHNAVDFTLGIGYRFGGA